MNQRQREFFCYVLPSVGAMLVTALYIVVDGIFVGQGVGGEGLAAVNIAVPFTTVIVAVAMMITMGGATTTSIRMGQGNQRGANESFVTTISMVLAFSVVVSVTGTLFPEGIARISGASSDLLLHNTSVYIRYYSMFAVFFCLSLGLSTFVRNDGNPNLALWGMVAGAVANVFLDWLFVFPLQMGIKGAAIASGLGQIMALVILSSHFIGRSCSLRIRKTKLDPSLIGRIIERGLPEFVTQMSQPVTILCYNLVIIRYLGETGISAFSVICYLLTLMLGVFIGVSQGIQPLISRSYGEAKRSSEQYYFRMGITTNVLLSIAAYLVLTIWGRHIIRIFNSDWQLMDIAYPALKVYGLAFVLAAVNIVYVTYFLSTKRTGYALVIAICRGFVLNTLLIPGIPMLLGAEHIWSPIVMTELLTLMVGAGIKSSRLTVQGTSGFAAEGTQYKVSTTQTIN